MTKQEAEQKLRASFDEGQYVTNFYEGTVSMDGAFTIDQLELILFILRAADEPGSTP